MSFFRSSLGYREIKKWYDRVLHFFAESFSAHYLSAFSLCSLDNRTPEKQRHFAGRNSSRDSWLLQNRHYINNPGRWQAEGTSWRNRLFATIDGVIVSLTLMTDSPIIVTTLVRTGLRSPSQWEGQTSDGRTIYVRYRWGCLEIGLGTSLDDAVANSPSFFEKQLGKRYDGSMEIEQLRQATIGIIEWPETYEYRPAPFREV